MAAEQESDAPETGVAGGGISALRAKRAASQRKATPAGKSDRAPEGAEADSGAADSRVRREAPRPFHQKAVVAAESGESVPPAAQPQTLIEPVAEPRPRAAADASRMASAMREQGAGEVAKDAVPAQGGASGSGEGSERREGTARASSAVPPASSHGDLVVAAFANRAPAVSFNAAMWDHHAVPASAHVPRAEEVLNQRFLTRETLNASVPEKLEVPYRIEVLKVVSGINHIPPADLVAVAVDWFLRGGKPTPDEMLPPWNTYVGPGTPENLARAEDALQERFIDREPLKWQTPTALQLNQRLAMYRVMNRLTKVPVGDIVTVAVDRWLRVMQY